ncbi:MAG: Gldg family protein [Paludibacteraceae bacterium]|nr:Gldg family protein [Paludibacteraceae bacterium]
MFVLVKKELRNFFSSAAGFVIIAVFLTHTGSFLWLMPSDYNILDGGYANLDGLFLLSPWLFMFLIPALTMKMFADETASGTMELLLTKPLGMMQIVMSKFIAGWMLSVVALVPTLLYMVSVGMLGVTPFNLDLGGFWGSFIGLVLLSASYTAIGVFCSSLSRNSIVSFTLSALLSFLAYYGFEALSDLVSNAEAAHHLASLGIASHYDSMSRGVLALTDVLYFVFVVALFVALTVTVMSGKCVRVWIAVAACAALCVCSDFFTLRLDLTSEKRYTLSDNTKNLMRSIGEPLSVEIYLDGDMNRGFLRLKDAVLNMVKEMNAYSSGKLQVKLTDPSEAASALEREKNYASLNGRGLKPTMVYDRDAKGGMIQKVVFPWAVMSAHSDTVNVCLLENIAGKSGDENLNASVEALEYKITDAIRRIMNKSPESVAFLEGHGEFSEPYVYSVTERLSAYYNVDRGVLGKDASVLDRYKVVIVAGPVEKFSEADKYIIDQYIMRGGRVLWLIDGVRTDK